MSLNKKLAEKIYNEMIALKAQGNTLEEIEKSEEGLRRQRIAVIRIALENHDTNLKYSIHKNITAFLLGYNGSRYAHLEKQLLISIMHTKPEDE